MVRFISMDDNVIIAECGKCSAKIEVPKQHCINSAFGYSVNGILNCKCGERIETIFKDRYKKNLEIGNKLSEGSSNCNNFIGGDTGGEKIGLLRVIAWLYLICGIIGAIIIGFSLEQIGIGVGIGVLAQSIVICVLLLVISEIGQNVIEIRKSINK